MKIDEAVVDIPTYLSQVRVEKYASLIFLSKSWFFIEILIFYRNLDFFDRHLDFFEIFSPKFSFFWKSSQIQFSFFWLIFFLNRNWFGNFDKFFTEISNSQIALSRSKEIYFFFKFFNIFNNSKFSTYTIFHSSISGYLYRITGYWKNRSRLVDSRWRFGYGCNWKRYRTHRPS